MRADRQNKSLTRGVLLPKKSLDCIFGDLDKETLKDFMGSFCDFVDQKDLEQEDLGDFFYKMQDSFILAKPDFDFNASFCDIMGNLDDKTQDDGFIVKEDKKNAKQNKRDFLMNVLQKALQQWEEADEYETETEEDSQGIGEEMVNKVLQGAGVTGKIVGVRRKIAKSPEKTSRSRSRSNTRRVVRVKKPGIGEERKKASRGRPKLRAEQEPVRPHSVGPTAPDTSMEVECKARFPSPKRHVLVRKDPITPSRMKESSTENGNKRIVLKTRVGGKGADLESFEGLNSSGRTALSSKTTRSSNSRTSRIALRNQRSRSRSRTTKYSLSGTPDAHRSSSRLRSKHPLQNTEQDESQSENSFYDTPL